jgi:signal transduction histidine kinase
LTHAAEEALYRIAQEALNNTLKHSGATIVAVRIAASAEQVELTVTDNGRGFNLPAANESGGMGLMSMRERAESLGGTVQVTSTPGSGTEIKITLKHNGLDRLHETEQGESKSEG